MIQKTALVLACLLAAVLSGCPNGQGPRDGTATKGFPATMVGVWETEVKPLTGSKWGMRFEPDGSLRKILHGTAGPVNLAEGGVSGKGVLEGSEFVFVMGDCQVHYDPQTEILDVVIPVQYFRITLPSGVLEGDMTDRFTGPASKDGALWRAQRRTSSTLAGAATVSREFADEHPEEIVFHKVDLSGLEGANR